MSHRQVILRDLIHIFLLEAGIVHQLHQALALTLDRTIEDATCLTGIAEVLVATQVELFELAVDSSLRIIIDGKVLALGEIEEYLRQFVRRIIVEVDGLCETALETGIGIDEVMHLIGITSNDTDKLAAIILQTLQKRINGFSTEGITIVGLQRIGLVDEQHATHRLIY